MLHTKIKLHYLIDGTPLCVAIVMSPFNRHHDILDEFKININL